jgi:hypothetical protein
MMSIYNNLKRLDGQTTVVDVLGRNKVPIWSALGLLQIRNRVWEKVEGEMSISILGLLTIKFDIHGSQLPRLYTH